MSDGPRTSVSLPTPQPTSQGFGLSTGSAARISRVPPRSTRTQRLSPPPESRGVLGRMLPSISPDDRRLTLSAFFCLFGILTSHTMMETARDALFLARLPVGRLPYVYLAIAALSTLLVRVTGGGDRPRGTKHVVTLPLALGFAAAVDGGFWVLASYKADAVFYALYIWSGIFGSWAVLTFWFLLARVVDVQKAKRLYPVIGAGALAGGIFGSLAARLITWFAPAGLVLLIASLVLVATALGPTLLFARTLMRTMNDPSRQRLAAHDGDEDPPAASVMNDITEAGKAPHVQKLLLSVLMTNMVATLIDFLFKTYVSKHVAPESYGGFFATTSFAFNLAALVVQLFFAGSVLRVIGAHRALQALPLLFVFTGVGTAFSSLVWLPLLYKGFDSSIRPSLMRTSNELLLLPLPDNVRRGAKVLIDLFGQRMGQAVASLFILGAMGYAVREGHMVAAIVAISAVTLIVNARIRPGYVDLFRKNLREGFFGTERLPPLDLDALETLFGALNSPREADVMASLEILRQGGKLSLVPDVILFHSSTEVVLRVLPWLAAERGNELHPILERLVAVASPRVRAAALRLVVEQDHDTRLLRTYLNDPQVEVSTTALVGLVTSGEMLDAEAIPALENALNGDTPRARVALFDAMAWQPSSKFAPILVAASDDPDPLVRAGVAHAIAKLGKGSLLPTLICMLEKVDVRDAVRESLRPFGGQATEAISRAMADESLAFGVRRQLPGALASCGPTLAIPALLRRLTDEEDLSLRTRVLRALRSLDMTAGVSVASAPDARMILENVLQRSLIGATVVRELLGQLRRGAEIDSRRETPAGELLQSFLEEQIQIGQENVFLALGLLDGREDYALVLRGLRGSSTALQASSRELLENVLRHDRSRILAILEPPEVKGTVDYQETMRQLLGAPSATARAIAAYHVRELDMGALRPVIMGLSVQPEDSVADLLGDVRRSMVHLPEGAT